MGGQISQLLIAASKITNQQVPAGTNYTRIDGGTVRLIITALDYKKTSNPLTCTKDGRNMLKLAEVCGVGEVQVMYDEQCTKENVKQLIGIVGSQCRPGDTFVFYYSGHGTSMKDVSGDEKDGQDEAFCFVTPSGQITYESCMIDDDFSECLCDSLPQDVQVLILTDCCHSGTIADLDSGCWAGRQAISITGCLDSQTSGDMGRGGIFTHSMLLAIDKLMRAGEVDYSCGMLFNATLKQDDKVFSSAQDITIQCTSSVTPDQMPWPLVPKQPYKAPLSQAAAAAVPAASDGESSPAAGADLQQNAELCEALGISPQVLQHVTNTAIDSLPENFQGTIKPMLPTCFALVTFAAKRICKP
mmetsp:Transcript_104133/g.304046  ORF Transcript_104133/g.304046 Transcript_104133/m.304046 type:complete len:358 (+) Transcript_104133:57-1130(+)